MSRCVSAVIIVVGLVAERSAHADTVAETDAAAAQTFFQRGRDAAGRADPADACANFEESLRLDPTAGTLFNLASCEEELGRLASAWSHLRDGLDRLDAGDPRRAPAQASLSALERRTPLLAVRLVPGVQARVLRDGVELANRSLGMPLPVNPGLHRITVQTAGHAEATFNITLAVGDRETLDVSPGSDLRSAERAAPVVPRPTSTLRAAGWVTGTLGLATLSVGAVAGALAYERSRVVHDHCESTRCDERGLEALDSAHRFASVTSITLGIGALLLTAGVTMWVVGKPDRKVTASPTLIGGSF